MNGVSNVSQPASFNGAQAAPPAGQSTNSGKLGAIPVRSAQGPEESPVGSANSPLSARKSPAEEATPSLGTPITERAAQPAKPPAEAPPTSLKVEGTAEFRKQVAQDLETFAPGTKVDDKGYVRAAAADKQVKGHEQGYQLINDLLNNKNEVKITYAKDDAFTSSTAGARGTPTKPGAGSTAEVGYDPKLAIKLPTQQKDGTIKDESVASSVVLAHELIHATHAQRGTIDRSTVDHTFNEGKQQYKESWRFEEFRTTGFTGFRQGTEPTENSIRAELGYNARATYLDRSSWSKVK